MNSNNNTAKVVFRSFALPVSIFDYLKKFQRDYLARHGVSLNNNQALAIILSDHQQFNAESEAHDKKTQRGHP